MISKLEETDASASPDLVKLAIASNISVSYLRHIFSKEVGIPPGRYLKLTRLARLRALLKGSNLRVKEAIAASGLSDFSHAVRDYKRVYGQTPSQTNVHNRRFQEFLRFDPFDLFKKLDGLDGYRKLVGSTR